MPPPGGTPMTKLIGRRVLLRPLVVTDFGVAGGPPPQRRVAHALGTGPQSRAARRGGVRRGVRDALQRPRARAAARHRLRVRHLRRPVDHAEGGGRGRRAGAARSASPARSTCRRCSGGRSSRRTSATGSTRTRPVTATCPRRWWRWRASPSTTCGCIASRSRSSPELPQPAGVEKLKIRDEGIAHRYLEINGVWEDHIRYALTVEEWHDRRDELVVSGWHDRACPFPPAGADAARGRALAVALVGGLVAAIVGAIGGDDDASDGASPTSTTIDTGGIEVSAPDGWTAIPVAGSASASPCRRGGGDGPGTRRAREPERSSPQVPGFLDNRTLRRRPALSSTPPASTRPAGWRT